MNLNNAIFCELEERHLPSLMKLKEAHKFYESLGFDGDVKRGFVINF
jgi:hypothetical protein